MSNKHLPLRLIIQKIKPNMKKLLTVLMIAGLFGITSCGNEQKSEEATEAPATEAPAAEAAPAEAAPAATDSMAAPADTAAAAQ